jgi:aminoglycoside phosphotransferase
MSPTTATEPNTTTANTQGSRWKRSRHGQSASGPSFRLMAWSSARNSWKAANVPTSPTTDIETHGRMLTAGRP